MSAGKKVSTTVEPELRGPIHKPFSWLKASIEHDHYAQFAALTMDICHGVETCIDLVYSTDLDKENGDRPLLNLEEASRLLRMAVLSTRLLGDAAERIMDGKNKIEEDSQ